MEMYYDDELDGYVIEIRNIFFFSEEEPEDDCTSRLKELADNYHNNLEHIIEFMLPELEEMYGELDKKDIVGKLGKPTIEFENGVVQYFEHSFDETHIFTFEFYDDEFNELEYFTIDG